jgi:hypothetical protein
MASTRIASLPRVDDGHLLVDEGQRRLVGDQCGARGDDAEHRVVDVAGHQALAHPGQPLAQHLGVAHVARRQRAANPKCRSQFRGDLIPDIGDPLRAVAVLPVPQCHQISDRVQAPPGGLRFHAGRLGHRVHDFEHTFDCTKRL